MIREEKFRISYRPYAVDLDRLRGRGIRGGGSRVEVDAVWFRRRSGVTVAVLGVLWDYQDSRPETVQEALARHVDGRYGGAWTARWDGDTYVSENPRTPEEQAADLTVLRPMLDGFPAVPEPYDGWWRFETRAEIATRRAGGPDA